MLDDGTHAFNSGTSEDGGKSKQTRALLDVLLLEHLTDEKNMSEDDIREEVATFMFAVSKFFYSSPRLFRQTSTFPKRVSNFVTVVRRPQVFCPRDVHSGEISLKKNILSIKVLFSMLSVPNHSLHYYLLFTSYSLRLKMKKKYMVQFRYISFRPSYFPITSRYYKNDRDTYSPKTNDKVMCPSTSQKRRQLRNHKKS